MSLLRVNPELQLIVSPSATYAALARSDLRIGGLGALRRPLVVAAVLGGSAALLGTRHATPALVSSTTICWSVVVMAQIAIALIVIAGPARRTVGVARALDLFFASHAPWSLWMLAIVLWQPSAGERSIEPIFAAMLLPAALTMRILVAYFRQVLSLTRRDAIVRTAIHQAITWGLLLSLYGAAVAAIPRLVEWFR